MSARAFYNEWEPYPAQWLRNLMYAGHIAKGEVDGRSIAELTWRDLEGFTQCHFFAGIGVWSHAARAAGIPDDFPFWSASLPCQPFSVAGAGKGTADQRHLWPVFFRLVCECRPSLIVGEQVSSSDALEWLDVVFADLESAGYACEALDLCAPSVGAPHKRQRLYWVAYRMADADEIRRGLECASRLHADGSRGHDSSRRGETHESTVVHANGIEPRRHAGNATSAETKDESEGAECRRVGQQLVDPGATRALDAGNFWSSAAWVDCSDGKRRPIESGTFPLADGVAARVGQLSAYGNAIVAPLATAFLRCVRDCLTQST